MANPFAVTPATSFAMQGLGQLAQATGGQFAQQRQQEQEAQTTQEFITLMGQAQSATDPAVKQRIFTEISANPKYKSQIENMRRQTALQMEQAELSKPKGFGDLPSDIKTAEWYRKATPEQRAAFDQTKRGSKKPIDEQIKDAEKLAAIKTRQEQTSEERKQGVKDLAEITKVAKASRKQLASINRLEQLNEKAIAGTLADARVAISKIGASMGIDIEGLAESEQFQAIGNTLVLDKSQQMSGALSNADMDFLRNTVPTLSKTREGREQMLDFARKLQQREIDYSRAAQAFRKEKGYFNQAEFDFEYEKYKDENPLFSSDSEKIDSAPPIEAPAAAIQYLQQNPQAAGQFKAKYGYLPEGF